MAVHKSEEFISQLQDSNEISKAGTLEEHFALVTILTDVGIILESKMAAINRK